MRATARDLALALALVSSAIAPAARATDACRGSGDPGAGPLPLGVGPADFGAIPEACPASELGLRLRGTLLVASAAPDFYGNAQVGAMLRGRHPLGARTWLSLALDVATFRYVANAVVTSSGFSLGPPTFGLHGAVVGGDRLSVTIYGRALLPFDSARQSGVETGLELGSAARLALRPRAGLEGGLALVAPLDLVAGQAHGALRPAGLVEGWYAPRPHLALFAGAEGRVEVAPDRLFTSIAPRLAARLALGGGLSLAAAALVPVAGRDRSDLSAGLYASWTPEGPARR